MIINKITDGLYRIEDFIPQVTMDYVNSLVNETTGWEIQPRQEDCPRRSKHGHHPLILTPSGVVYVNREASLIMDCNS